MKLSEMNTDKTLDVLCEITPYINEIAKDGELLDVLKKKFDDGKENHTAVDFIELGVQKINTIVPILLKEKRDAVYGILSVLNEKSIEEISQQKGLQTIKEIIDLLQDKELIDFFK